MTTESIRREFFIRARLVRKAVIAGALSVEEGKAKLHEELDDIVDEHMFDLHEKMQKGAAMSARRDHNIMGDDE